MAAGKARQGKTRQQDDHRVSRASRGARVHRRARAGFACNYVCLPGEARSLAFSSSLSLSLSVSLLLSPLTSARPVIPGSIKIPGGHDRSPLEIRVRLRPSSTSRRSPAYRFSDPLRAAGSSFSSARFRASNTRAPRSIPRAAP